MSELTLTNLPKEITKNLARNVCVCYDVPRQEVIESILSGAKTWQEVSEQTYACQGSGCCVRLVERMIEQIDELAIQSSETDSTAAVQEADGEQE